MRPHLGGGPAWPASSTQGHLLPFRPEWGGRVRLLAFHRHQPMRSFPVPRPCALRSGAGGSLRRLSSAGWPAPSRAECRGSHQQGPFGLSRSPQGPCLRPRNRRPPMSASPFVIRPPTLAFSGASPGRARLPRGCAHRLRPHRRTWLPSINVRPPTRLGGDRRDSWARAPRPRGPSWSAPNVSGARREGGSRPCTNRPHVGPSVGIPPSSLRPRPGACPAAGRVVRSLDDFRGPTWSTPVLPPILLCWGRRRARCLRGNLLARSVLRPYPPGNFPSPPTPQLLPAGLRESRRLWGVVRRAPPQAHVNRIK